MKNYTKVYIDLDGTLCGKIEWRGFWWNTVQLFKGLLYKPNGFSWTLLTSRPKIDYPIIKFVCRYYKIYPSKIITSPTLFYKFKDSIEVATWKSSVLVNSLSQDIFVDNVIYVDNDTEILSNIIPQKNLILCTTTTLSSVLEDAMEGS